MKKLFSKLFEIFRIGWNLLLPRRTCQFDQPSVSHNFECSNSDLGVIEQWNGAASIIINSFYSRIDNKLDSDSLWAYQTKTMEFSPVCWLQRLLRYNQNSITSFKQYELGVFCNFGSFPRSDAFKSF